MAVAAVFIAWNTLWYGLLVMVVGLRGLRERVQRFRGALDLAFAVGFVGLGSVIATKEIAALALR